MQAAMRAQDRDAIRQIMAARNEGGGAAAASPSPQRPAAESPARAAPAAAGASSSAIPGAMELDDLDEMDALVADVEAPAPAPASAPVRQPPVGTSWMDAVMNEIEEEVDNPFVVPEPTRAPAPAPSAAPIPTPTSVRTPSAISLQAKGMPMGAGLGPGLDGTSADDIMSQLAASEARLNAAREGTAGGAGGGGAAGPAVMGPGAGGGGGADADLDELDDLLEEFM